ncbi:protein phosphatase-like protein 2A regulatory subunit B [Dimargaris cristalligena]|uniref:Serine/threonine-protein phosphatase 2A activator n=1 Tax=Dimargaris cristalligena TaxID=215637 RepID=A0A4P9ZXV2_9FUNG|nr:protein phosphatase-like protein 2A regulatory subunit B [Dimargaris cristalligena]|eukprot:RKP38487.1 protein phosphatase-like protein 2A regulatory subunit B [Dimargaris cristalligena]
MNPPGVLADSRIPTVNAAEFKFQAPTKSIRVPEDIPVWLRSRAFDLIMTYLTELNDSVKGTPNSTPCPSSKSIDRVLELLDTIDDYITLIPPDQSAQSRYGNPAFRQFIKHLQQNAAAIHRPLLNESPAITTPASKTTTTTTETTATTTTTTTADEHPALVELVPYLTGSFGNETRIDYGSGHELSFFVWLLCLQRLGYFPPSDRVALVVRVFSRYLDIARRLQLTYRLEPAGSHGVWGLDDYQFIPYIFGSAQFIGSTRYTPAIISENEQAASLAPDYMLMRCIQFIKDIKQGPFFEHSPVLHDISGVPYWTKVNKGLQKMYVGDVLSKFPVVQHLPFGNLIKFEPLSVNCPRPC